MLIKFFDNKAKNYNLFLSKFPFNVIRSDEYKKVLNLLKKFRVNNSLELGCGNGFYTSLIRKISKKKVYVVDSSKKMLEQVKIQKVIKVNQDILNININQKFDFVAILGTIEFVKNYNKIFRQLKKNFLSKTTLLILMPNDGFINLIYYFYYKSKGIKIYLHNNNLLIKDLQRYQFYLVSSKASIVSNIYVFKKR